MVCSKLQIKRYEYKQFLKFSKIHSINTSKILNRCLEKSTGENISSVVTSCLQFSLQEDAEKKACILT